MVSNGDLGPTAKQILVTGMHRSGTSAVAGALSAGGAYFGEDQDLIGATESNERGHFEHRLTVAANERLLQSSGGSWLAPPERLDASGLGEYASGVRSFLQQVGNPVVALKDPRFCVTLASWMELEWFRPAAIVLVIRHPVEVARSLETRDGLPLPLGIWMWWAYNYRMLAAAKASPDFALVRVDFERVVQGDMRQLRALEEFGVSVDGYAAQGAIQPALRHENSAHDDHVLDGPVASFWSALQESSGFELDSQLTSPPPIDVLVAAVDRYRLREVEAHKEAFVARAVAHDQLLQLHEELVSRHEDLNGEYRDLTAEYDSLTGGYQSLSGEYELLLERHRELLAHRDALLEAGTRKGRRAT